MQPWGNREAHISPLKEFPCGRRLAPAVITPEFPSQLTFTLLLLPFGFVIAVAVIFWALIVRHARREAGECRRTDPSPSAWDQNFERPLAAWSLEAPQRWCAVRSSSVRAVQTALGLQHPRPCNWGEGVTSLADHALLLSPPVDGWILVIGQALPDPAEDADISFHFLRRLSRDLGVVQFFSANRALNHHAWARVEDGKIQRAYAWAGETIWNQGTITRAETELKLKCLGYGELPCGGALSSECVQANTDKVNSLAARWSLDPDVLNDRLATAGVGIVGELIHLKRS